MTKRITENKTCYGSYRNEKKCGRCVYRSSCRFYTSTASSVDSRMGLVSFDNSVDEWLAVDTTNIPGMEKPGPDRRSELISALAVLFRWIMSLDTYTLGIVAEIIAPGNVSSKGVSIADLAALRGWSRQAIHEKMLLAVAAHPELASLFQTVLRRVGSLRSKFRCRAARKGV